MTKILPKIARLVDSSEKAGSQQVRAMRKRRQVRAGPLSMPSPSKLEVPGFVVGYWQGREGEPAFFSPRPVQVLPLLLETVLCVDCGERDFLAQTRVEAAFETRTRWEKRRPDSCSFSPLRPLRKQLILSLRLQTQQGKITWESERSKKTRKSFIGMKQIRWNKRTIKNGRERSQNQEGVTKKRFNSGQDWLRRRKISLKKKKIRSHLPWYRNDGRKKSFLSLHQGETLSDKDEKRRQNEGERKDDDKKVFPVLS